MHYFRIRGKFLIWSEYYNQSGIYQTFLCISPRTTATEILSNPEAYSEPCQTSKIGCFTKTIKGLKSLTFFVKHSTSGVWIRLCYSLDGKNEVTNKIDVVGLWSNLLRKRVITTTFYFDVKEYMCKKKLGKCK